MNKTLLSILLLVLASLACGAPTWAPAATPTTPPATNTPPNALVTVGNVYIRDVPNGTRVGSLELGATVYGSCSGDWCQIEDGYIWRGCTDDNPEGLGCAVAP
jgi:hypothetical protein